MADLTNSHSLTEFQRNARGFIDDLNTSKNPVLLTVNGKVQAILVDPMTFQEMERRLEHDRFIEAIRAGEQNVTDGKVRTAKDVFAALKSKHGF